MNFGALLESHGEHGDAWRLLDRASMMVCDLEDAFVAAASEADALDYASHMPSLRSELIACSRNLPNGDEVLYTHLWRGKAAVARALTRRQASLSARAATDSAISQMFATWADSRRELSRLILAPSDGTINQDRLTRIQQLSDAKEHLERQLAEAVPDFARDQKAGRRTHTELQNVLPERTVVVDLVQYSVSELDPEQNGIARPRKRLSYMGFVLGAVVSPGASNSARPHRSITL